MAERVARAAGDLVRDGRPDHVDVASTKSSPTDVVTAMDTASEALLRGRSGEPGRTTASSARRAAWSPAPAG